MKLDGKSVVITGGASGIGAAIARAMHAAGSRVCIADLNLEAAEALAQSLSGVAVACDVSEEAAIQNAISVAEAAHGPVDIFVSNAGFGRGQPDHAASADNDTWNLNWQVHVMSHVYAARALLPAMIERGEGYFVNVASAAGLLNQIGDAAYSATKHAAVSFAESLHITHRDQGIGVSVICPQYVATPLIGLGDDDVDLAENLLSAGDVAACVIDGIQTETFRVLPHPQVAGFATARTADPERWLQGMRMLKAKADRELSRSSLLEFYTLV